MPCLETYFCTMCAPKPPYKYGFRTGVLGLVFFLTSVSSFAQKHCPTAQKPLAGSKGVAGYAIFQKHCAPCHEVKGAGTGPDMRECAAIYQGNKAGLVQWLVNPGRKRRKGPQMPPQTHLTAQQLSDVADWILTLK